MISLDELEEKSNACRPLIPGARIGANEIAFISDCTPENIKTLIACLREAVGALQCNTTAHRLGGIDDCEPCKVKKRIESRIKI